PDGLLRLQRGRDVLPALYVPRGAVQTRCSGRRTSKARHEEPRRAHPEPAYETANVLAVRGPQARHRPQVRVGCCFCGGTIEDSRGPGVVEMTVTWGGADPGEFSLGYWAHEDCLRRLLAPDTQPGFYDPKPAWESNQDSDSPD